MHGYKLPECQYFSRRDEHAWYPWLIGIPKEVATSLNFQVLFFGLNERGVTYFCQKISDTWLINDIHRFNVYISAVFSFVLPID